MLFVNDVSMNDNFCRVLYELLNEVLDSLPDGDLSLASITFSI